ncbi:hypothetical protein [Rufibacter tibetensis]|uniref:DUF748 domain-containing protein n=1 Tax=Rufibacter tibetensis TaxID=512763 RepID=A0A0P0CK50_9BACT|nr:hypothetical protein [Rufibacter tibetensis]ALI99910.1 hypothetical protein DC20_14190 [Rufibacter tibetensis]
MEQEAKHTSKSKKYLAVGATVLVVILVLLLFVSQNLNTWAEQKLKKQISTQSKGLYALQMSRMNVSLLTGSVALDSLELTPSDSVWNHLQRTTPEDAPASISHLKASKVQVRGISFVKLLFGGAFGVSSIQLNHPDWTLQQMKKDTTSKPLHETVGEKFREIGINEINIKEGAFRFRNKPDSKAELFSLSGADVQAEGVQLDSVSFQDETRAFYSKNITASVKKASFMLPDGNYKIKSGLLQASTKDKVLSVTQLQLIPLRSATEMSREAGQAVTRFHVQVPELRLGKVDFGTMSRNSNIYIGSLVAQKPKVNAYKDGKMYPAKGSGIMPHELIQKLTFGVNIRTAKVRDLYVRYEELSEKAFKTGYVTGSNIDLTLTNLTNDKNLISRKRPAVLKGSGLLMGKARLQATVRLALLDPNWYHSIEGTIGKGYPAILNPMVEPSMFVSVKSGVLQSGSFRVELTKTSAQGSMKLQYEDFKIDMLNKDEENKQSLGNKIKSLVANKVVLKSASEEDGKAPREGKIQVKRRSERSFLTYWKDCLANGVLSVIGAPM